MMKSNRVLFLLASFIFLLGSCSKELSREDPTHNLSGSGTFYATIDGQLWQADSIQQAIMVNGALTITGIGKAQDAIAIVLPDALLGVYTVNAQTTGFAFYTNLQDTTNLYLTNTSTDVTKAGGTVTMTQIDTVNKTVSGTFQFNLYEASNSTTKTVTGGVFNNISYGSGGGITPPVQPPPPSGGSSTDTLNALVDGAAWDAAQVVVNAQSGMLIIGGVLADGQQTIGLYMPSAIIAGTYPLDFNSANATYFATYSPDPQSALFSIGSGNSLTITSNDTVNKHIKGSFNFVGKSQTDSSSATISNGYFSVSY